MTGDAASVTRVVTRARKKDGTFQDAQCGHIFDGILAAARVSRVVGLGRNVGR